MTDRLGHLKLAMNLGFKLGQGKKNALNEALAERDAEKDRITWADAAPEDILRMEQEDAGPPEGEQS